VHTCLGEPLARAVMTVVLAAVAQHWRLEIDDEASAPGPRAPDLRVTVRRR
jgi:cytochrome P450